MKYYIKSRDRNRVCRKYLEAMSDGSSTVAHDGKLTSLRVFMVYPRINKNKALSRCRFSLEGGRFSKKRPGFESRRVEERAFGSVRRDSIFSPPGFRPTAIPIYIQGVSDRRRATAGDGDRRRLQP